MDKRSPHCGLVAGALGLITAALAALAYLQPAYAMSCKPADPWFLESISLDQAVLQVPAGVAAVVVSGPPGGLQSPGHALVHQNVARTHSLLTNQLATPLYLLVDRAAFASSVSSISVLLPDVSIPASPVGLVPIQYASNQHAFTWTYLSYEVQGPGSWIPLGSGIPITDGGFGISPGFEDRLTSADNRPPNVAVPEPQTAHLTLAYGGQVLTIPFTVSYSLNPAYTHPVAQCPDLSGVTCILGLLGLLVFGGTITAIALVVNAIGPRSFAPL